MVMPCLLANPLRGRTWASYPRGTAMANPQGIIRISPGCKTVTPATAAARSNPAECLGHPRRQGQTLTTGQTFHFTVIGRATRQTPAIGRS